MPAMLCPTRTIGRPSSRPASRPMMAITASAQSRRRTRATGQGSVANQCRSRGRSEYERGHRPRWPCPGRSRAITRWLSWTRSGATLSKTHPPCAPRGGARRSSQSAVAESTWSGQTFLQTSLLTRRLCYPTMSLQAKTGLDVIQVARATTACPLPNTTDDCLRAFSFFVRTSPVLPALSSLPLLVGAFIGAPLVARELDQGTYLLAWTQGVPRQRWLLTKLAMLTGLACLGFAVLAGLT